MEAFLPPLLGGVLIGVSSTLVFFFLGKITGISGILGSLLSGIDQSSFWKISFLGGLILGGFLLKAFFPQLFNYNLNFEPFHVISAGLLVGFGTRLGSGCTSGHGVCGLPRLSKRSLVPL